MSELRIDTVAFSNGAVIISYFTQDDVRVDGHVGLLHQAQISLDHPDYAEDAERLERWAQRLLKNALEDWAESSPYVPEDEPDDDEEFGSRHNPDL